MVRLNRIFFIIILFFLCTATNVQGDNRSNSQKGIDYLKRIISWTAEIVATSIIQAAREVVIINMAYMSTIDLENINISERDEIAVITLYEEDLTSKVHINEVVDALNKKGYSNVIANKLYPKTTKYIIYVSLSSGINITRVYFRIRKVLGTYKTIRVADIHGSTSNTKYTTQCLHMLLIRGTIERIDFNKCIEDYHYNYTDFM